MAYDPHFNFFSELNGREIFMYKYARCFIKKRNTDMHVTVTDEYGIDHLVMYSDLSSPSEEDMSDF